MAESPQKPDGAPAAESHAEQEHGINYKPLLNEDLPEGSPEATQELHAQMLEARAQGLENFMAGMGNKEKFEEMLSGAKPEDPSAVRKPSVFHLQVMRHTQSGDNTPGTLDNYFKNDDNAKGFSGVLEAVQKGGSITALLAKAIEQNDAALITDMEAFGKVLAQAHGAPEGVPKDFKELSPEAQFWTRAGEMTVLATNIAKYQMMDKQQLAAMEQTEPGYLSRLQKQCDEYSRASGIPDSFKQILAAREISLPPVAEKVNEPAAEQAAPPAEAKATPAPAEKKPEGAPVEKAPVAEKIIEGELQPTPAPLEKVFKKEVVVPSDVKAMWSEVKELLNSNTAEGASRAAEHLATLSHLKVILSKETKAKLNERLLAQLPNVRDMSVLDHARYLGRLKSFGVIREVPSKDRERLELATINAEGVELSILTMFNQRLGVYEKSPAGVQAALQKDLKMRLASPDQARGLAEQMARMKKCGIPTGLTPDETSRAEKLINGEVVAASNQEKWGLFTKAKLTRDLLLGPQALAAGAQEKIVQYLEKARDKAKASNTWGAFTKLWANVVDLSRSVSGDKQAIAAVTARRRAMEKAALLPYLEELSAKPPEKKTRPAQTERFARAA